MVVGERQASGEAASPRTPVEILERAPAARHAPRVPDSWLSGQPRSPDAGGAHGGVVVLQTARSSAPLPRRNPPQPGSVRSLPRPTLIFASPSGRASSKIIRMRRRAAWRLLQQLLVFVVAVACGATTGYPAHASTSGAAASALIAQTEPPPGEQPAEPDSGSSGELYPKPEDHLPTTKADSTAARPDSVSTVPSDSTSAGPADSSA